MVLRCSLDLNAEPTPHAAALVSKRKFTKICVHWPPLLPVISRHSCPRDPTPHSHPTFSLPLPPCQHGTLPLLEPQCPLLKYGFQGSKVVLLWVPSRALRLCGSRTQPTYTIPTGPSRQLGCAWGILGRGGLALPGGGVTVGAASRQQGLHSAEWSLGWFSVAARLGLG